MLNKPKCIHIWLPGIQEGSGGIQNFCRDLITSIVAVFPEADIHLVVKNDAPDLNDAIISSRVTWTTAATSPIALRTASFALAGVRAALNTRPDLIIACHVNFLPAVAFIAKCLAIPYTTFIYGIDAWKTLSWPTRRGLMGADRIFSISSHTTRLAVANQHLGQKPVHYFPCSFNTQRYVPGPKPAHLLARYGLHPDQPVILTVSRLANSERYKGHEEVINSLPAIRECFPTIRYLIGGIGTYADVLKQKAVNLGVSDLVLFTGYISNDELCAHYQLCDVFAMPSQKEGFGIVFLEAMACGKPVIAGDRDGSVDALDGGRLGILVDPTDPAQIASAVIDILSHSHSNTLLFNPNALRQAVIQTFGTIAFNQRIQAAFTPLINLSNTEEFLSPSDRPPSSPHPRTSATPDRPRITVLTQLTSPYQIEFFNVIAAQGHWDLSVVYLTSHDRNRLWHTPDIHHRHVIINGALAAKKEAKRWLMDADLIVFNTYLFSFALSALWKRARSGKPWVFWGERPGSLNTGRMGRLMRKILLHPLHRHPVPIWGMGQYGIQGYQAEYGSKRSYHNLPYASNLQRFFGIADRPPSDRVFLFSGRFTKRKGADLIAIAFARIAAKHPDTRLIIVGSGPLESSMRGSLASCSHQVEWLGFQPWTEMPAALAKGTILCLPSRYDGWGLALVEGLASGMPAIGTDKTGSAVELLSNHQAGWLIPANNADALANAMELALTIDDHAFHAKQLAARAATQTLDANQAAQQFLTLCLSALSMAAKPQ